VALVHNPDAALDLADLGADLILAGHTHGKKPTNSAVRRALFPMLHGHYTAGRYELPGGKHLYVNPGIGNSRRTCASTRPEITLITLRCPSRMGRWGFDNANAGRTEAPALMDA
jgi:predicted MPP superfamily phosphohydrolase